MTKKLLVAVAIAAAILFSGCTSKPDESVIKDLLGQTYAQNLGKELAANFEIKAKITDQLDEQNGGYTVFFDYTIKTKADGNATLTLDNLEEVVTTMGALDGYGLLFWSDGVKSVRKAADNELAAASLGIQLMMGELNLLLIKGGMQYSCAKAEMKLKRTEEAWLLTGGNLPKCAVPPEVIAAIKAENERQRLEAEKELAKPLVEVQNLPTITNSFGMEFVLIPAGTFQMGCYDPADEPQNARAVALGQMRTQCYSDEKPIHKVTLTKPFYIAKLPYVTVGQRYDITGERASYGQKEDDKVVINEELIEALNKKEDTTKYRLPTEAELDYAMRAGTTTKYFWGDSYEAGKAKYERGDPNQYGLSYVYMPQSTSDCEKKYSAEDQVDPKVTGERCRIVSRGGNATQRSGFVTMFNKREIRIVKDQ